MYAWGSNFHGQLGCGMLGSWFLYPWLIPSLSNEQVDSVCVCVCVMCIVWHAGALKRQGSGPCVSVYERERCVLVSKRVSGECWWMCELTGEWVVSVGECVSSRASECVSLRSDRLWQWWQPVLIALLIQTRDKQTTTERSKGATFLWERHKAAPIQWCFVDSVLARLCLNAKMPASLAKSILLGTTFTSYCVLEVLPVLIFGLVFLLPIYFRL